MALAACSTGTTKVSGKTKPKEYFAESEYGVQASPRVASLSSGLPRGGGREQIGKPYKIKGKWYYPQEDPDYVKVGAASWYGDAFHGRLTANGEIYDMTHLTAAHPTMPLPSYARVTNLENGSSVIVRVNDRGPFAHGRIIDLSRRAAELLDYTHAGIAKVEVEYIGRAPLHGRDDRFLMASYRPGDGVAPGSSDGLPAGVMIAMNGPTPTAPVAASASFPGLLGAAASSVRAEPDFDLDLPEFGPIAPDRPGVDIASVGSAPLSPLAYAEDRVERSIGVMEHFASGRMAESRDAVVVALKRRYAGATVPEDFSREYVAVGTFASQASAETMARALAAAGRAVIQTDYNHDGYVLKLYPDGRLSVDEMLRTAWAAGASDAMTIRD